MMTISLRLENSLNRKLAAAARAKGVSKSDLVRQCIDAYFANEKQNPAAWELGKDLFACYDSGRGDLSTRAKEIARERAHARRAKKNRR